MHPRDETMIERRARIERARGPRRGGWRAMAFFGLGLVVGATATRAPSGEILGLRLGMSREAAIERLERIGRPQGTEDEEGGKQSWALKDRRYRYVVVGFDADRLAWFSLFARPGGRPVLMRELGDLARAKRQGNYIYVWSVPSRGGRAGYEVIARSLDPDTLQSLSVAPLPGGDRARQTLPDSTP